MSSIAFLVYVCLCMLGLSSHTIYVLPCLTTIPYILRVGVLTHSYLIALMFQSCSLISVIPTCSGINLNWNEIDICLQSIVTEKFNAEWAVKCVDIALFATILNKARTKLMVAQCGLWEMGAEMIQEILCIFIHCLLGNMATNIIYGLEHSWKIPFFAIFCCWTSLSCIFSISMRLFSRI